MLHFLLYFNFIKDWVFLISIYRMNDDIASNCSHSVISPMIKTPCNCEIHSKPPLRFGTFLTTDFGKEFEKSNIPCDCQWEKWKGYNRHLLNESKIERIKKRICKAASKIEIIERSAAFNQQNLNPESLQPRNDIQDAKPEEESMKLISNLSGLSLLFKISCGLSENGKLMSSIDINMCRAEIGAPDIVIR